MTAASRTTGRRVRAPLAALAAAVLLLTSCAPSFRFLPLSFECPTGSAPPADLAYRPVAPIAPR